MKLPKPHLKKNKKSLGFVKIRGFFNAGALIWRALALLDF
jgi:hypothetical protein